jgi:hypothetical protein
LTCSSLSTAAGDHLVAIARCPILAECLSSERPAHACSEIALTQWAEVASADRVAHWRAWHQLPEPWVGHLEDAPILFVSSNPSIRGDVPAEPGPAPPQPWGITREWSDERIIERYENAFDRYMIDGVREAGARRATRYWVSIKRRAEELVPRPVRPGLDYALTEVVRCKSRSERGVPDAVGTCASRYLLRTFELSGARMIVGIGAHARRTLRRVLGLRDGHAVQDVTIGERTRLMTFLPHPASFGGRKSFQANLSPDDLARLRAALVDGGA